MHDSERCVRIIWQLKWEVANRHYIIQAMKVAQEPAFINCKHFPLPDFPYCMRYRNVLFTANVTFAK